MAQKHVSDLVVTPSSGGTIKWYTASLGANEITDPANTVLVTSTTYYASQTVNGIESADRRAVTVTLYPASVAGANPLDYGILNTSDPITFTTTAGTGTIHWWVKNYIDEFTQTYWSSIPESGIYSGTTSTILHISNPTGMGGYRFKAVFTSGVCTSAETLPASIAPPDPPG